MLPWKSERRILLAVTGGIAAYKAPEIVRTLKQASCDVEVMLSKAASAMVSPLVLSTLTGKRCWVEEDFLSSEKGWEIPHITLADWAEAVVVAPCTAATLQRVATGAADSLIAATLLATRAPVLLFPAMNVKMWDHPATQENIRRCRLMGYHLFEPEAGHLACGYEGKGRLPERDAIVEALWRVLSPRCDLVGKRVLVTAGPTWEFLDPVRYLGNPSTGRMGFAVAQTAWYRGAEVTVIAGPTTVPPPPGVSVRSVTSAQEMFEAVLAEADEAHVIVKAAAVGDFRAAHKVPSKIKRGGAEELVLHLVQNPDIAASLGSRKRPGQVLIGFAAETDDLEANALDKLRRKGLDAIVANDVTAEGAGFASVDNRVTVFYGDGTRLSLAGTKETVAWDLWESLSGMILK